MSIEKTIEVPDIGDSKAVEVIEVLIKAGDEISAEDSLITLESDKAAMEIPSPFSGLVKEVIVKVGDKVGQGSAILTLVVSEQAPVKAEPEAAAVAPVAKEPVVEKPAPQPSPAAAPPKIEKKEVAVEESSSSNKAHASPSVRRFARELGAEVEKVKGTGPKGRILKEDVQAYIKSRLQQAEQPLVFAQAELIDFSQFGPIETQTLSRIQKISGSFLHKNWVSIPHVTHHEAADITDLEAFRLSLQAEAKSQDIRLTLLPFMVKALVSALKAYPTFNASLNGDELVLKRYYHIGIAIDTADGLVVPTLKDADQKSIYQLAKELAEMGEKARAKKLKSQDLQGGTFTISSLGGIGGTGFTPIINAPEVAIIGICKAKTQPCYIDGQFEPRLMLPLSLSFDHRVIDGALAARFCVYLSQALADIRRVLL